MPTLVTGLARQVAALSEMISLLIPQLDLFAREEYSIVRLIDGQPQPPQIELFRVVWQDLNNQSNEAFQFIGVDQQNCWFIGGRSNESFRLDRLIHSPHQPLNLCRDGIRPEDLAPLLTRLQQTIPQLISTFRVSP